MSEIEKNMYGLEYSSRWFEYHANQRQDVFKIFLIVCAGVLSASAFIIQFKVDFSVIPAGIVTFLFSLLFYFLDRRSRKLIEIGEEAYIHYWKESGLSVKLCPPIRARSNGGSEIRYKHAYIAMFFIVGLYGIAFTLFGVFDGLKMLLVTK